ncbi:MAG TPA: MFS transporter, partial [Rhizomicrobium sp.]|nr:MFS transporter [Rhizomicrobium sp.]
MPALLLATALSRLAVRMFSLAIVLYALERFHSPVLAGWVGFASIVPGLLVSPIAGAALDRVGPVFAIVIDMATSTVLMLAMILADALGLASPAALMALVALYSLTNPLSRSGIRTLLPRLVSSDQLDTANALDTAIYAVTDVIGPGLAGVIIGFSGALPALIVIALIFGIAAVATARIRHVGAAQRTTQQSFLREALDGVVVVFRQPTLRTLALSYSLHQVTWGVLVIAVPVLSLRLFAASQADAVTGFLWAASGIAGGVGALVAGHLRVLGRERRIMALGMLIAAFACWPVAPSLGIAGLVFALIIVGAVSGPVDVGLLTLRQRRTDPAKLGRVLSVSMSLNVAGFPIGSALAGVLITRSLDATFAIAAAASLLGSLAVLMIPHDEVTRSSPPAN